MKRCEECDKEFSTSEALGMHNRSKHPDKYNEPKLSHRQKRSIWNTAAIALIILAIVGTLYVRSISAGDSPIVEVAPDVYNFGIVSQAKGPVNAFLDLTNRGLEPLVIDGMETSCGCTSARIINDGVEGPSFGMAMHGTNPTDWQITVSPGETVQLKVTYDPNVHKDLRGAVTRTVTIHSNTADKTVKIMANQVD